MTGEMSRDDVTREAFPAHFAVADALGGTVEPFDVYQGPYVAVPPKGRACARRIWICAEDSGSAGARLYDDLSDKQSPGFIWCGADSAALAADLARDFTRWRKVRRTA